MPTRSDRRLTLTFTLTLTISSTAVLKFKPLTKNELRTALAECVKLSPDGNCASGPHGPIANWDVSSMTNMIGMFYMLSGFNGDLSIWDVSNVNTMHGLFRDTLYNGDISQWDVSNVKDMSAMFAHATSFNGDVSKWEVSSVRDMSSMFFGAATFKQTLCGAWADSKARKFNMFQDSPGSICRITATDTITLSTTTTTITAATTATTITSSTNIVAITTTATTATIATIAATRAGKHTDFVSTSSPSNDRPRTPMLACTLTFSVTHPEVHP